MNDMCKYDFICYSSNTIPINVLKECSELFSNHYGVWDSKLSGRVKLSVSRLKSGYLFDDSCYLIVAKTKSDDIIVGYIVYTRFYYEIESKYVNWITQLCIHKNHRNHGIATSLCRHVHNSKDFACGIVSSHPYAIKALEKATGKQCDLKLINKHAKDFIEFSKIPYVQEKKLKININMSLIDTQFFVNHNKLLEILKKDNKWILGPLIDGHEFFAFVFN
jgi:hypothetical protein